jgi:hypothetical protein
MHGIPVLVQQHRAHRAADPGRGQQFGEQTILGAQRQVQGAEHGGRVGGRRQDGHDDAVLQLAVAILMERDEGRCALIHGATRGVGHVGHGGLIVHQLQQRAAGRVDDLDVVIAVGAPHRLELRHHVGRRLRQHGRRARGRQAPQPRIRRQQAGVRHPLAQEGAERERLPASH